MFAQVCAYMSYLYVWNPQVTGVCGGCQLSLRMDWLGHGAAHWVSVFRFLVFVLSYLLGESASLTTATRSEGQGQAHIPRTSRPSL